MNYKMKCNYCGVTSYFQEKPDVKTKQLDEEKIYELKNSLKKLYQEHKDMVNWRKKHIEFENEILFYLNKYFDSNFAKKEKLSFGGYLSKTYPEFWEKTKKAPHYGLFANIQRTGFEACCTAEIRLWSKHYNNDEALRENQNRTKKLSQELKEEEKSERFIICPVCGSKNYWKEEK